jgi:hypothetical protein
VTCADPIARYKHWPRFVLQCNPGEMVGAFPQEMAASYFGAYVSTGRFQTGDPESKRAGDPTGILGRRRAIGSTGILRAMPSRIAWKDG